MYEIFDYVASIESTPVESPVGEGVCIISTPDSAGTGTSGMVGNTTLPSLTGTGVAHWGAFSAITLPALDSTGTTANYHPAWGDVVFPSLDSTGEAHELIKSSVLLPPLFVRGLCGANASQSLPFFTVSSLDSSFNRSGSASCTLPLPAASGLSCGLDKPIENSATSAAVVSLLQQGNMTLADAAASICAYDDTDDDRAMSVTYFVSNLMAYVQDSASGIGDRWTCALATWLRKYGDCEEDRKSVV